MNYNIEDERISKILDEMVEEYRVLLIANSVSDSQESDDYHLNVSTLLRLMRELKDFYFMVNGSIKNNILHQYF